MAHVFISYKHEDGDFAEILKSKLEKAKFETWTDSDIQGGEPWSPTIDNAIENSFALVVVMSPEARQSEFITYEWSVARGLGKEIVPILLRATDLHPKLAEFQYIDFTNRNARPWDKLIDRLKKLAKAKGVLLTRSRSQVQSKPAKTPKAPTSAKTNPVLRTPIVHQVRPTLTKDAENLLIDTERFMLSLGSDVRLEGLRYYVACKRSNNFASIVLSSKIIFIYVKLNPDDVNLDPGFTRDTRHIGHHGTGDLEITLKNSFTLDKAKPLIIESYNQN